jgi:hypothetical protein
MNKIKKIGALLGIKGVLAVASLMTVAVALVVYSAAVTITPTQQFTVGASSDSWAVYINDVNEVRYLPGNYSEPTFDSGNTSTYAFRVVTGASRVCAVKIELTSAMSSALFSNFNIAVSYWDGGAWASATLYDSNTGVTTITAIDGLTTNAGYLHQAASTDGYYLVEVTYSYDKVDTTSQVTADFRYTPLPQDDFT